MDLTPREKDKLLVFTAALLAERRMARGIKLNYPETIAYISAAIMDGSRAAAWMFASGVKKEMHGSARSWTIPSNSPAQKPHLT